MESGGPWLTVSVFWLPCCNLKGNWALVQLFLFPPAPLRLGACEGTANEMNYFNLWKNVAELILDGFSTNKLHWNRCKKYFWNIFSFYVILQYFVRILKGNWTLHRLSYFFPLSSEALLIMRCLRSSCLHRLSLEEQK